MKESDMKHLHIILITLFVCLFFHLIYSQDKVSIAMLDLEGNGVSKVEARTLSDELRSVLVQSGSFIVVERNNMEAILNEQGFQMSGCTSTECAVEAGRLLGVNKMIAGSVGKLGTLFNITIRMFDVQTGQIEKTVSKRHGGSIEQLLDVMKRAGYELTGDDQKITEQRTWQTANESERLRKDSFHRHKFGIKGGITSSKTTQLKNSGSGISAGGVFSLHIRGDLFVPLSLLYTTREFEYYDPEEIISYENLQLAVMVAYYIRPVDINPLFFKVQAGPAVNFILTANKDYYGEILDLFKYDDGSSAVNDNEMALVFGPGIGVDIGNMQVFIEAVYEIGLTAVFKDDEMWEVGKNRTWSFMVGLEF
jgi:TolB-like protein